MKKSLIILMLFMLIGLSACSNKVEEELPTVGLANPMVEKDSLQTINDEIGTNIVSPPVMGKSDEKFFVINGEIAQYNFSLNGNDYTIRGARIVNEDISGVFDDRNEFEEGAYSIVYGDEYYLGRFFDGEFQYTIVVSEPKDLSEETFELIVNEIMNCAATYDFVGNYVDTVSQRASATISYEDNVYYIIVSWSTSANETTTWSMEAHYENGGLTYGGENFSTVTVDADGNETIGDGATDNIGWFEVSGDKLLWTGAAFEQCRNCVFEKVD